MDERIKLKPGEELVLTVPKKKPSGGKGAGHKKKGPISAGHRGEYLPRRRQAGGINFYDIGQIRDGGGWTDFDIDGSLLWSLHTVDAAHADWGATHTAWTSLTDLLFASFPDVNTWKDTFRKVEYAEAPKYGINIVDDWIDAYAHTYPARQSGFYNDVGGASHPVSGSKWTPTGLSLKASDLTQPGHRYGISTTGLAFWFTPGAHGPGETYYTGSYDPDAAHVAFDILAGKTNIYLVPMLMTHLLTDAVDFPNRYLLSDITVVPRSVFLNMTDSHYAGHFFEPLAGEMENGAFSQLDAANFNAAVAWAEARGGARFFESIAGVLTPVGNPGNVWVNYYQNLHLGFNLSVWPLTEPGRETDPFYAGPTVPALVAVIEQKGNWYYVWWNGGVKKAGRLLQKA
jgi:hypothetical protein